MCYPPFGIILDEPVKGRVFFYEKSSSMLSI